MRRGFLLVSIALAVALFAAPARAEQPGLPRSWEVEGFYQPSLSQKNVEDLKAAAPMLYVPLAVPPTPEAAWGGLLPPRPAPLSPEREAGLRPADVFKECDVCPEMVVIPAGRFLMGSPPDERWDSGSPTISEWPQHEVTIARPFAVGRFAVTAAEYRACLADGGCESEKRPPRPATRKPAGTSWLAAKDYVRWLSAKTGRRYRLLTEAELEYIIRAGTTTPYPTGDTVRDDQALFYEDSEPIEVGSYPPNAFGLYDTIGNLGSWAEDCWHDDYVGAPADGSAWLTGDCEWRLRRGGGSRSDRDDLRSARRTGWWATEPGTGLRVARDLEPVETVTSEAQKRRVCEDLVRAAFVRDGESVARERTAHEAASAEASRVTFEGWQLAFSILRYAIGEKQARDEGDRATERALRIQREALEAESKKNEAEKAAAMRRREQAYAALQIANQNALLRKMSKECVSSQ